MQKKVKFLINTLRSLSLILVARLGSWEKSAQRGNTIEWTTDDGSRVIMDGGWSFTIHDFLSQLTRWSDHENRSDVLSRR
eukprot:scaffold709_cov67-Cyclotella_meneghiniana.AAC.2